MNEVLSAETLHRNGKGEFCVFRIKHEYEMLNYNSKTQEMNGILGKTYWYISSIP